MQLSDLRYITQEDLDDAHINITSAEMFEEARLYNIHMHRMQRKKWLFYVDFWGMFLLNLVMVPMIAAFSLANETALIIKLGLPMVVFLLLPLLFAIVYSCVILYRKLFEWWIMLIATLLMLPAGYAYIILALANSFITFIIRNTDEQLKAELGYPHFVELRVTYIRKEDVEEQKKADPYSTYVKPPEDDGGFLFNSGIDDIAGVDTEKNDI